MNLFESINNSLNNTVKNLSEEYLTEKKQKQEISPEDQRDNEIIRDLIRRNKRKEEMTPEELDVLNRNGISPSSYNDGFYTELGFFDDGELSHSYVNGSKYIDDIDKVNFADMGRKQKERADNHIYYNGSMLYNNAVRRGRKKSPASNRAGDHGPNELDIERRAINNRLDMSRNNIEYNRRLIARNIEDIEHEEKETDRIRNSYLDMIKAYKEKLKELEGESTKRVDKLINKTERLRKENDSILQAKRDRIKEIRDRRNSKNESVLLEKKVEMSPEDEEDNNIIRRMLDKYYNNRDYRPTREERDVLNKHGLSFNGDWDDFLYTDLGTFDASDSQLDHDYYCRSTGAYNSSNKRDKNKINFVDMARKQRDRKNYYKYYFDDNRTFGHTKANRGKKKNKPGSRLGYGLNGGNTQDIERMNYNRRLGKEINDFWGALNSRDYYRKRVDSVYDTAEKTRDDLLQQIKILKKQLAELDGVTEKKASEYTGYANDASKSIRQYLDDKKERIQASRNKKKDTQ